MRKVTKVDDIVLDSLGKRIKYERTQLGMSQEDLAEKIFVKREKINYIENDSRQPNIYELKDIADVLQVSTDYILGRVSSKKIDNTQISKMLGLDDVSIGWLKAKVDCKDISKSSKVLSPYGNIELFAINMLIKYVYYYMEEKSIFKLLGGAFAIPVNENISKKLKESNLYINTEELCIVSDYDTYIINKQIEKIINTVRSSNEVKNSFPSYLKYLHEEKRIFTNRIEKVFDDYNRDIVENIEGVQNNLIPDSDNPEIKKYYNECVEVIKDYKTKHKGLGES